MDDILRVDDLDRRILALLALNSRATYDEMGREVSLSAPAVKRRVSRLVERKVLLGFTTIVDASVWGTQTEALIELFYAPGISLEHVSESLRDRPEIVEAWSVTGDADCIARARARDSRDLERLIMDLQRDGSVIRTRTQVIMSRLIERRE